MVLSENRRRGRKGNGWRPRSHPKNRPKSVSSKTTKTKTLHQLVKFQEDGLALIETSQIPPQPLQSLATTPPSPKATIKHVTGGPVRKNTITTQKPPTSTTFVPAEKPANIRAKVATQKPLLREQQSPPPSRTKTPFKGIFTP